MGARWLPVGWLGERQSGRVPGWAQMPDRAGAEPDAVVADEEASSSKTGL